MLNPLVISRPQTTQAMDYRPERPPWRPYPHTPSDAARISFLPCRLLLRLPEGTDLQIQFYDRVAPVPGRSENVYWGTLPAAPYGHRRRMTLGEPQLGQQLPVHELDLEDHSVLMLDVPAGESVGFDVTTDAGERIIGHRSEVHAFTVDCTLMVSVASRARFSAFHRG